MSLIFILQVKNKLNDSTDLMKEKVDLPIEIYKN